MITKVLVLLCLLIGPLAAFSAPHKSYAAVSGCGNAIPSGVYSETMDYGGLTRTYTMYVPTSYTDTVALPLLVVLPGTGMTALDMESDTHLNAVADQGGFLVVYPEGVNLTWDTGTPTNTDTADDEGFISALVGGITTRLCVDTSRIGVAGYSVGATMAYRLVCDDLSWVADVYSVAGEPPTWPYTWAGCTMAHATPIMEFHGEQDTILPYNGTSYYMATPAFVQDFATLNDCGPGSVAQVGSDVYETLYTVCANNADTILYSVTDGGHTWPGGMDLPWLGVTTQAIDASTLIGQSLVSHYNPFVTRLLRLTG